jgi:hypothetical protein
MSIDVVFFFSLGFVDVVSLLLFVLNDLNVDLNTRNVIAENKTMKRNCYKITKIMRIINLKQK